MTRYLVAGGTGFVGRHLVGRLARDSADVAVLSRSSTADVPGARTVVGDVADRGSLEQALDGVDVAYYLVHSLTRPDYARFDRDAAAAFADAAVANGVRRVVYLGGLGRDGDDLSDHLRSRRDVEQTLAERIDTAALRASIVVGEGGISWELLCQLVERLPAMVTPRWVDTRTQPIGLDDVVEYLARAAEPRIPAGHYDVGVPEPTTYREMMRTVADLLRRPLLIVPVPFLTPRLSARWVRWVSDVDVTTARNLIDSLGTPAEVTERRFEELTGHRAATFTDAAASALVDRIGRARESLDR